MIDQGTFNRAAVITAVRAAFERYEDALLRNDVTALNGFFLTSENTVRYGLAGAELWVRGYRGLSARGPSGAPAAQAAAYRN